MTLPKVIYLGATDIDVKRKKHVESLGNFGNDGITIKAQQPASDMRDTLLHELLHAIIYHSGARKTLELDVDAEEKIVVTLSPWLLAVLRDNPKLVEFLLENREREY